MRRLLDTLVASLLAASLTIGCATRRGLVLFGGSDDLEPLVGTLAAAEDYIRRYPRLNVYDLYTADGERIGIYAEGTPYGPAGMRDWSKEIVGIDPKRCDLKPEDLLDADPTDGVANLPSGYVAVRRRTR